MTSRQPEKQHLISHNKPWFSGVLWFVSGALLLAILSIFQKKMIGADPFVIKGFIVPILFGGSSALSLRFYICRSREQLVQRLRVEQISSQHVQAHAREQELLTYIINQALSSLPLNEALQRALEKLLALDGFDFDAKGSVFLVNQDSHDLDMVAHVGMAESLLIKCAHVAPGQCLCGRVAVEQGVVYANHHDHRHETTYEGLEPHGHYCAPIKSEEGLLGVLNLYLPPGHVRSAEEDAFISTITGALATTIRRKLAERALRHVNDSLEARVEERTRELRVLSSALDQSSVMVFITDRKGEIEYVNAMFTKMTGYEPDEVLEKNPRLLKSDKTPEGLYDELWQTILTGGIWRGELLDRHKDGSSFWVSTSISSVKDENGEITHFVALHEDISERKKTEAALVAAREQAEAANRVKAELLANTSHELRTPLNAIIGFSATLKQGIFGPLANDKQAEYITDIHNSGTHLLELINDILDVSSMEAGKLELHEEPCDLGQTIESSLKMVKQRARDGNVQLTASVPGDIPNLLADGRRIKQIVINLLSNAIKFTPAEGEVSLSVHCDDADLICLTISDTGIGMDEGEVLKALTEFGQIDSGHNRKYEGTGLGLPLTKGLVELHDGQLQVHSQKDQGTQVTVTFPPERTIKNAH